MIALGGVAFATIPDSTGTIHACAQKNSGNLRVVDQGACRGNETPLAWTDGSRGSSGVVARPRSASPVETTTDPGSLGDPSVGAVVPMNNSDWIQGPNETDHFAGEVSYTNPDCPARPTTFQSAFFVFVFVGDHLVASGVGITGPSGPGVKTAGTVSIDEQLGGFLFEPGAATNRSLTVRAVDSCDGGKHVRIDSVKLNVEGIS
jgi:hypothetical protein